MEGNVIKCRIDKYCSVIKTLIKGGIHLCHPSTLKQVYSSLVAPTLTCGIDRWPLEQTKRCRKKSFENTFQYLSAQLKVFKHSSQKLKIYPQ